MLIPTDEVPQPSFPESYISREYVQVPVARAGEETHMLKVPVAVPLPQKRM